MSDTISKIKLGGVTYTIDDQTKVSQESFDELMSISNENKSFIELANNKLDELLNKALNSGNKDFFKCAIIGSAEGDIDEGAEEGDLFIENAPDNTYNGLWKLEDRTATGFSRIWMHSVNDWLFVAADGLAGQNIWYAATMSPRYQADEVAENPWDCTWTDDIVVRKAVTSAPERAENTWSGYKAILVTTTETMEIPGGMNILVSDAGSPDVNGTYELLDEINSDLGSAFSDQQKRIFQNEHGIYLIVESGGAWAFSTSLPLYGSPIYYTQETYTDNPWGCTWMAVMGVSPVPTVTYKEIAGSVETKEDKYYDFEKTLTEGLTYGKGFTPVVDKVYDSEAMIMATLFVKEPPILSTPDNLTSYENDEWKVNATNEFASFVAWHAFDGNPDSIWVDSGSGYLTWQNKLRQVLVKQLEFIYDANAHNNYIVTINLEGSDNGSEWSEIGSASLTYVAYGDYVKATVTFPNNETSYFYHRIYARGQGRNLIGSLIGKRVIE